MDKTSKKLLFALKEKSGDQGINFVFEHQEITGRTCYYSVAKEIGINKNECSGIINYLKKTGYLIPRFYSGPHGKTEYGVSLSHEAIHYKEFQWISFKKYVAEKWIDFLALVISGFALIISIISMLISLVTITK